MQLGWKSHTFPLLVDIHHFMDLSRVSTATPLVSSQTTLIPDTASQGLRTGIIDRLPSSMQFNPPVAELHLDTVPFSTFLMAVNQVAAMRGVCSVLHDTVGKLLDVFPTGWRKVCFLLGTILLLLEAMFTKMCPLQT